MLIGASGSVGDRGDIGVTAESRNKRIVTVSGHRRKKATASAWLIDDMSKPFTYYVRNRMSVVAFRSNKSESAFLPSKHRDY